MTPGKLYKIDKSKAVTIWSSDWNPIVRTVPEEVFLLISYKTTNYKGEYILKVLTSGGIIGCFAINSSHKSLEIIMVSPPEDGNFEI